MTQTVADNKSAIEGSVATLTQTVADNKADIEGKLATAKTELESYADGAADAVKTYVDGDAYKANFDEAGAAAAAGAAAESNANAYTDALYNSIVVASLSDIDSIFGVTDHNHEA